MGSFNKLLYFIKAQTEEHAETFTHSQFHHWSGKGLLTLAISIVTYMAIRK